VNKEGLKSELGIGHHQKQKITFVAGQYLQEPPRSIATVVARIVAIVEQIRD
jgi:hypothetical protein